ncbi:uncharacterized mitochondrial protein AtMg00810-like [Nicotiana tomentosiformis]|uniref:uncharacterized mitochondrial protein AtMg00810-like n=1 Tax=Nicotiana tomentosiformis TaxID=4098 RepID=UPI00388C9592
MIIIGNNEDNVARLQDELSIRFDIKKLGELHYLLSLEITNMNKGIFVTQEGYAKKLVDRFGLKQSKTCSIPLEISTRLRRDKCSLLTDPKPFRALIRSLMYLTITRPGIAFSVGYVNKFMQRPRKPHLEAANRILKYINSTSDMSLFFQKKNDLVLAGYTDADFGGDSNDRRSTSGYIFLCGGTSVSWCSQKQESVSLSTTKAEYKAATLTAQECMVRTCTASSAEKQPESPVAAPTRGRGRGRCRAKGRGRGRAQPRARAVALAVEPQVEFDEEVPAQTVHVGPAQVPEGFIATQCFRMLWSI